MLLRMHSSFEASRDVWIISFALMKSFAVHLSSLGLNVWIFKNFKQLLQLKLTHNTSIVHPLVQMKYQRSWIRQKYFLFPEMTGCRSGLISTCHVVLHSRFIFYLERAKQLRWTWLAITNLQSIFFHSLGCLSQRGSMVLFHNRFEGESTKCSRPRSLFSPSFLCHTPFSPTLLTSPPVLFTDLLSCVLYSAQFVSTVITAFGG